VPEGTSTTSQHNLEMGDMARKITPKRAIAAGSALLIVAATLAMVLPAGADTPSAVRLHLATDGRYFAYGNTVQNLTPAKNGCQITSAESIISLTAAPGTQAAPGIGPDGIGVKPTNNSSNGTPCSQVDGTEVLTVSKKAGGSLGSRAFIGVALDLELTGNGVAKLAFTPAAGGSPVEYTLQTGNFISAAQTTEPDYDTTAPYDVSTDTSLSYDTDRIDACAAPNSSGPNSGSSDNCRWTVYPGFNFNSFSLRTTSGTVSLEGSGDFGGATARESLLFLSNSAPTAVADSFTTAEDTALTTGNVLSNDTDPDGNSLTAIKVTDPAHGTLSLNADGTFTYTPDTNYNNTTSTLDTFTYKANDGVADSDVVSVSIRVTPVNDPPVPNGTAQSTNEDSALTFVVATDIDSTEGDVNVNTCTLTDSATPPNALSGGSISNGSGFNITVTPPPNFFGTMLLSCTITDSGGASTTMTTPIQVGVTGVNDAPVAAADTAQVNDGDTVDINVLANDTDIDSAALTPVVEGAVTPSGGTATVNANGTVHYDPPAITGDAPVTGSFSYRASDGSLQSNLVTVTVTIYPVICTTETVGDVDDPNGPERTSGSFTRLEDNQVCKRYTVDADKGAAGLGDETVKFNPDGATTVAYRGILTFPADAPPVGEYPLLLRYDPNGGNTFKPVQWCVDPQFTGGLVTSATLPGDQSPDNPDRETWCVAKAETVPNADGDLVTTWQVYGEDDPKFTR
jgi:VCBS repeat-containing protein